MSAFTNQYRVVVGLEFARWCQVQLFGLHYNVNLDAIKEKDMILTALEIDDTANIFSSDTIQCLEDKVQQNITCNCS